MYKITRTVFEYKDGREEVSDAVVYVENLEEYRQKIKKDIHQNVNFMYSEEESNDTGKNSKD